MQISKKFKIINPYFPEEKIVFDANLSEDLAYDYSECNWISIDTEFINLNINHDKLCLIQIASMPKDELRVELIWVWEKTISATKLSKLMQRTDLEILMHVATADLSRLIKFTNTPFEGKLYDTKVAARIALTNINHYGMKDLISLLIDNKFGKDKSITSSQWDTNPYSWDDKMFEYAVNDVVYLHPLKQRIDEIASRRGSLDLLHNTMKILPTVVLLHCQGFQPEILGY